MVVLRGEHILTKTKKSECLCRYISWDERCKIGWLLKLEHSESNRSNFKANSFATLFVKVSFACTVVIAEFYSTFEVCFIVYVIINITSGRGARCACGAPFPPPSQSLPRPPRPVPSRLAPVRRASDDDD